MNNQKGMRSLAQKTISFRLTEELATELKEKAAQKGKDLSNYCRGIVLKELKAENSPEIEQLKYEIEELKRELEITKAIQIYKKGGRPRKLKGDDDTKTKILSMYQSGRSLLSIAKEMDMAYSTIYRICKKYK